jgi:hypothetical protein
MMPARKKAIEIRDKIMRSVKISFTEARILTVLTVEQMRGVSESKSFWDEVLRECKHL